MTSVYICALQGREPLRFSTFFMAPSSNGLGYKVFNLAMEGSTPPGATRLPSSSWLGYRILSAETPVRVR